MNTYRNTCRHKLIGYKAVFFLLATITATAALPSMSTAQVTTDRYSVREVGSFHIGGRQVELRGLPEKEVRFTPTEPPIKLNPNGEFETGQMYVQYVKLDDSFRKGRFPLLMWHGGGLSGVTWETKPDGKPGWQQFFLRNGYDVYVSDAVERGRSSWSRFPEIYPNEPIFRTKKEAWELFRIGPSDSYKNSKENIHYNNTEFPIEYFDQFVKQVVPRWVTSNDSTLAAYDALVNKVCPCVIVVHSQGSTFAYTLANKYPQLIQAVVGVEPSGALDPKTVDMANLSKIPQLYIWGDNIANTPRWQQIQSPLKLQIAELKNRSANIEEISLPDRLIYGNSHMLMMDRNSDQIAQIVHDWLKRNKLSD